MKLQTRTAADDAVSWNDRMQWQTVAGYFEVIVSRDDRQAEKRSSL